MFFNCHIANQEIPSKKWDKAYRHGFNGHEKDNEIKGFGNSLNFGERMYDSRLGGFLSRDKMADKYPEVSPYAFVRNNPIMKYDPDGNTDYTATVKTAKGSGGTIIKNVTVDIVYNIVNISNKDVYNANQVVGQQYKDQTFSGSFSDKDAKGRDVLVNVTTNVTYKMANTINQAGKNENIMLIVDDISSSPGEKGVSNPVGMARLGGNVMAVEHAYISDKVLMRHEQGHNLGFEFGNNPKDPSHSPDPGNYMYSKSATGKNTSVGPSASGLLKQSFGHFKNMNDGTYGQGSHNAAKESQNFVDEVNIQYDEKKAKAAGIQ